MINNKWHSFFFFLQNCWLGSWTKPDAGRNCSLIWFTCTLSKFSILLLLPTFTPIPWKSHSCQAQGGIQDCSEKWRLWTVPQQDSRKQNPLEKQSVAAAAIHNNTQHQLTASGCHSRLWQKVCFVHPFLSSNEFVNGDGGRKWEWSGNDLSVPCRQTPPGCSKALPYQGCLIRAHPYILHHHLLGWWRLTVAALFQILGKLCKLNPCGTSLSLRACKPNRCTLYPYSLLLLVCHTACSAIGKE